jgi:predicted AAA+ superfamily ATPase
MISRKLIEKADELLNKYPVISITGPRQSGKTTMAQMLRPEYKYVTFENPEHRRFANEDPVNFLETYCNGVILDEVQYVPELFSYLQIHTDKQQKNGEFILTGSQNFLLLEKISQSLAGRVAVLNLLPFSMEELENSPYKFQSWESQIVNGFFPRKIVNDITSEDFYNSYIQTYIERDVRQIKNILNLGLFQKFLMLLSGRIGQLFNQNSLGMELGLDNKTINAWMNVLETSFIAFRLSPYFENFNKRLVSTPKVYFYDTGVAAHLLGIRTKEELNLHFSKGALFENLVILELMKKTLNTGKRPQFYFWRDNSQHEIDLLVKNGTNLEAIEIKSGKTIQPDFAKGLKYIKKINPSTHCNLVYGGDLYQKRNEFEVFSVNDLNKLPIV